MGTQKNTIHLNKLHMTQPQFINRGVSDSERNVGSQAAVGGHPINLLVSNLGTSHPSP